MDFKVWSEDEIMCNKHFFFKPSAQREAYHLENRHFCLNSPTFCFTSNLWCYCCFLFFFVMKEGKYLSVHSALSLTLGAYPVFLFLHVVGCSVSLWFKWVIQSSTKHQLLSVCF